MLTTTKCRAKTFVILVGTCKTDCCVRHVSFCALSCDVNNVFLLSDNITFQQTCQVCFAFYPGRIIFPISISLIILDFGALMEGSLSSGET